MSANGARGQADRIGLAISLGLSPYEARAYLVLLERGESKASMVATASRIPRGRIYEVLESLHAKGSCPSCRPSPYATGRSPSRSSLSGAAKSCARPRMTWRGTYRGSSPP